MSRGIMEIFLAFVLLLSFIEGQQIEKTIRKETKAAGEDGELVCTVSELGTNKIMWEKLADKPIVISTETSIMTNNPKDGKGLLKYEIIKKSITEYKETYTLKIRRLQDSDSGWYRCTMIFLGEPVENYPRARGELVVQLPPSMGSNVTPLVQAAVGGTAILQCEASGVPPPKISWSRANGTPLPGGLRAFYGTLLEIKNVTSEDRGTYRCRAENNVKPPALQDYTLDVFHKPILLPFRTSVGQAPGRNYKVRMSCRMSGNPEPVARWYRLEGAKRTELNDDEKYHLDKLRWQPGTDMKIGDFWFELEIKNVGDGDAGQYECSGSNEYGTAFSNVTLFMTTTCQTWKCWRSAVLGSAQTVTLSYFLFVPCIIIAGYVKN